MLADACTQAWVGQRLRLAERHTAEVGQNKNSSFVSRKALGQASLCLKSLKIF
ncbi:hypothetical protein [Pseudomonas sp. Irchel 3E20]|uniref:hypothetical protein n=1 Tax=Pseudomonas sp. Irchel 3E20 TaxID=2008983 RepID=UPI0015961E46|nr:hypothetical protein [Pseudomonas sp. Irchel 3E20]